MVSSSSKPCVCFKLDSLALGKLDDRDLGEDYASKRVSECWRNVRQDKTDSLLFLGEEFYVHLVIMLPTRSVQRTRWTLFKANEFKEDFERNSPISYHYRRTLSSCGFR